MVGVKFTPETNHARNDTQIKSIFPVRIPGVEIHKSILTRLVGGGNRGNVDLNFCAALPFDVDGPHLLFSLCASIRPATFQTKKSA